MRSEPVSPPQGAGSSPILSVGVPTYNQAEYLQQTLDSLVNLPRQPLEIVVSENHCTDQTSAILEQYGDAIRVIRPPTHLSMMANWNYLISHLNGEWVVLLSSDDLALPNYVEVLERGTTVSPAAVLVKTSYQRIDRQGRVTKTKHLRATQTVVSPPETLTGQLTGSDVAFGALPYAGMRGSGRGGFRSSATSRGIGDSGCAWHPSATSSTSGFRSFSTATATGTWRRRRNVRSCGPGITSTSGMTSCRRWPGRLVWMMH